MKEGCGQFIFTLGNKRVSPLVSHMPTDTLCQGKCIKGLLSDARAPLRMLRKRESASVSNVHPMWRGDEKGRYLDEQVFLWETLRARAQICLLRQAQRW